jgi:hypothetical protein
MGWPRETAAGKWKACYRDPSGRTISRTFGENEKTKGRKWYEDQESAIRVRGVRRPEGGQHHPARVVRRGAR